MRTIKLSRKNHHALKCINVKKYLKDKYINGKRLLHFHSKSVFRVKFKYNIKEIKQRVIGAAQSWLVQSDLLFLFLLLCQQGKFPKITIQKKYENNSDNFNLANSCFDINRRNNILQYLNNILSKP